MVKYKTTFSLKIGLSFVESQILGIKKIGGPNIENRYSIFFFSSPSTLQFSLFCMGFLLKKAAKRLGSMP